MKIEKTPYKHWNDAYTLILNDMQLVVVTEIGPRIMSLTVNEGQNVLFNDDSSSFQVGDWRVYGGHRLWISPETEACYAPDNHRCEVTVKEDALIVTAPVDPLTHLQKRLEISACNNRFVLRHVVRNTSQLLYQGGLWTLTCVEPTGTMFFPWGRPGSVWEMKTVHYWTKWGGAHQANVESAQWKPTNDLFLIEPTGEEGKVGSPGYEGFIGIARDDCTFIKQFTYIEGAEYPDSGCSLEAYTSTLFLELETLSPLYTFYPGEEYAHEETWFITPQAVDPCDGHAVRALLRS